MHYSTAKIIARVARRSREVEFFHQLSLDPVPSKECGWREVSSYSSKGANTSPREK